MEFFKLLLDPNILLLQLLSGFSRSMLLFLISSGLTLILGVLGVVNFAHGSLYMLGAYLCFTVTSVVASVYNFWFSLLIVPVLVGIIGGVIECTLLRRIYKAEEIMQMLLTYGIVLIVADLVRIVWGVDNKIIPHPPGLDGSIRIGNFYFPKYSLFVIAAGPFIALFLWFIIYKTQFGKKIRAVTEDREMASCLGIDISSLFTLVFMIGCYLAGLGGALAAPFSAITLGMDVSIIIESFVVVVIGGLGNIWGALIGTIILGVAHAFGILVLPRLAMVSIFIIMALVLIVRPWGLLGSPMKR